MLRAYLFLLIYVPFTIIMSLCAIVSSLFDGSGRAAHHCARVWGRSGLLLGRVKVKVTGLDNIPAGQPLIFMGNHQGNFDILALLAVVPVQFAWIAKEELFRIPVFGHSMRRAGYIPLDRSDGRRALKSMANAAEKIRGGSSVVIFPEGTRTKDGALLPFKKGGFILATMAGVPIVPFTINGSLKINPCTRITLYPGTLTISFSAPIPTTGSVGREELQTLVRSAIAEKLEQ